jgi:hypothetical protein
LRQFGKKSGAGGKKLRQNNPLGAFTCSPVGKLLASRKVRVNVTDNALKLNGRYTHIMAL